MDIQNDEPVSVMKSTGPVRRFTPFRKMLLVAIASVVFLSVLVRFFGLPAFIVASPLGGPLRMWCGSHDFTESLAWSSGSTRKIARCEAFGCMAVKTGYVDDQNVFDEEYYLWSCIPRGAPAPALEEYITKSTASPPVMRDRFTEYQWLWIDTETAEGRSEAPKDKRFTLAFGKDFRMSATTDCNTLEASYVRQNKSLHFGPIEMTKMFCAGSRDGEYAASLAKTVSYETYGARLWLIAEDGTKMFFSRSNGVSARPVPSYIHE